MFRYVVKGKKIFAVDILIKQRDFFKKKTEFMQQAVSHHLEGEKVKYSVLNSHLYG